MDISIRWAELADYSDICGLMAQIVSLHHGGRPDVFKSDTKKYSREEFVAIINDINRPVFVAVDTYGHILGYCFCMVIRFAAHAIFNDYSSLYIDDLCVDKNHRRQGVGRSIFEDVNRYAREIGVYNIDLNVWEFNESARKFYESCGFTTQRRRMEMIL